jgi:hypothetical protein
VRSWHGRAALALAATVAATGLTTPPLGAAPAPATVVPKGTPYAAEVTTKISGWSYFTVTRKETIKSVCEAQSAVFTSEEKLNFTWDASYPQVTVPVATYQQLGKAYARLHVDPTPTADGTGGLSSGNWIVNGQAPKEAGGAAKTDCSAQKYSAEGLFKTKSPKATVQTQLSSVGDLGDPGPADVVVSLFDLSGASMYATPASWTDPSGATTDVMDELDDVSGHVPQPEVHQVHDDGLVSWDALVLANAPQAYAPLISANVVTIGPLTDSGTVSCGKSHPNGTTESTCSLHYAVEYFVKLYKHFLYVTQRAYPR